MASEEDLRVADKVLTGTYLSYDHKQSLRRHVATAITTARAETWEKAIELAKSVECLEGFSGHWQNGHSQAKAVIIGLFEAAAGSKTKVVDEQKNQGR